MTDTDVTMMDDRCLINTEEGPVCGYIEETNEHRYYKFEGIPYAKPPMGKLRFLAPQPQPPWTDVLDCTKEREPPLHCTSHRPPVIEGLEFLALMGSEDCLYITLFTPDIKPKKPLPVMFWIGGHGFISTQDHLFDPSLINDEEIILVRCGFRLGPLGFLSINDFTAPGNSGLKDIVMALRWIQRNIHHFGGDPNNVTIFGSSSGGAIVHLLMLSPMAAGLFHKAIIQSASALNNWAIDKNPSQSVLQLAEILNINETDVVEIVEILKRLSAEDIMNAFLVLTKRILEDKDNHIFDPPFKPCIEEEFEGQPTFLSKSPVAIIKSGKYNKVPMIIGSNNFEGSFLQYVKADFYEDYQKFNDDVCLLVPKALALEKNLVNRIGNQLLNFYLDEYNSLTADTKTQYLQMITDYYFSYYINKTVRLHSQVAPDIPIYYYIVNFAGEWCLPKSLEFYNSMGHGAEVPFLFKIKVSDSAACKGSKDSAKTRARMVKMWTNFAHYGNPTPDEDDPLLQIQWDPVKNEKQLHYLSIGSELTKGKNPFLERMEFWDQLHHEYKFLRVLVYFHDLGVSSF